MKDDIAKIFTIIKSEYKNVRKKYLHCSIWKYKILGKTGFMGEHWF